MAQQENYDWRDDAVCRSVGTDLFFSDTAPGYNGARLVCDGCEVKDPCLANDIAEFEPALKKGHAGLGMRGGLSSLERREIVRLIEYGADLNSLNNLINRTRMAGVLRARQALRGYTGIGWSSNRDND